MEIIITVLITTLIVSIPYIIIIKLLYKDVVFLKNQLINHEAMLRHHEAFNKHSAQLATDIVSQIKLMQEYMAVYIKFPLISKNKGEA